MRKHLFTPILIFCIVFHSFSQSWDYQSARDEAGGEHKIAYVVGKGGREPYTKPSLQMIYWAKDGKIEISFSNMGYTGCGGTMIKMKFDEEEKDIDYIWQGDEITTDAIAGFRFLRRRRYHGKNHY